MQRILIPLTTKHMRKWTLTVSSIYRTTSSKYEKQDWEAQGSSVWGVFVLRCLRPLIEVPSEGLKHGLLLIQVFDWIYPEDQ